MSAECRGGEAQSMLLVMVWFMFSREHGTGQDGEERMQEAGVSLLASLSVFLERVLWSKL